MWLLLFLKRKLRHPGKACSCRAIRENIFGNREVGRKKKSTKMCLDLLVLSSLVSDSLHTPGEYHITDLWNSSFPGCLSSFSACQLSPTLCDPKDCSMPGLPVHHQFQEIAQNHVRWISDTIQPSHSLSAPPSQDFNLSQHQGHFASRCKSIQLWASTSVFLLNIKDWSLVGWTGWISSQSKGHSNNIISNNTIQMNPSFRSRLSLWSNPLNHTWLQEKP